MVLTRTSFVSHLSTNLSARVQPLAVLLFYTLATHSLRKPPAPDYRRYCPTFPILPVQLWIALFLFLPYGPPTRGVCRFKYISFPPVVKNRAAFSLVDSPSLRPSSFYLPELPNYFHTFFFVSDTLPLLCILTGRDPVPISSGLFSFPVQFILELALQFFLPQWPHYFFFRHFVSFLRT